MSNRTPIVPPADKEPVKVARMLHYLYDGGTLNRFEASSKLHDTCLNSTVSTLRNRFGIVIRGQDEIVKGFRQLDTHCQRYWLDGALINVETAYQVLTRHFGYQDACRPAA